MTIVFAILMFSLLIFIHELGHFVAAKLSGVQVNEFAIFMGPAIVKWQRGETLYSIRCIPFGGYCAMEGEDEDTENPRSFQKAAWWKRLIILVAGVAMNFVMGVVLMGIYVSPAKAVPTPQIGVAKEGCTVVREGGLQVGDTILEVDGEKIYIAGDVGLILQLNPGDTHDLVVERNGEKLVFNDYRMEKVQTEEGGSYRIEFATVEGNFVNKLSYTWNASIDTIRNTWLSLKMLFTGQVGLKDMSGPVGIVQTVSETAGKSPEIIDALMVTVYFGAFISINLAVMNLLPIPAVDGGRVVGLLLTTAIEAITRKKVNPKYEGYIHAAGLILLLGLMAVIMFKDIFTIFKG